MFFDDKTLLFSADPNIESSAKMNCWQLFSGYTQVLFFSKRHSGKSLVICRSPYKNRGEKESKRMKTRLVTTTKELGTRTLFRSRKMSESGGSQGIGGELREESYSNTAGGILGTSARVTLTIIEFTGQSLSPCYTAFIILCRRRQDNQCSLWGREYKRFLHPIPPGERSG